MSSFPILPKIRLSPHPLPPSLSLRPLFIPIYFFGCKICTFSLLHRDSPRTPLSMFNDAKTQKNKNKKNKPKPILMDISKHRSQTWRESALQEKTRGSQHVQRSPCSRLEQHTH